MNFHKMRKEGLLAAAVRYNLPNHQNLRNIKVGHLRELLIEHFEQYLERWFLERVKSDLLPRCQGLFLPARNKTHIPGSNLEFDFSWKSIRLAVEIQGGIDSPGRNSGHVSPAGIRRDMRKMVLAQLHGWMLLQLAPEHIHSDYEWMSNTLPTLIAAVGMCRNAPRLKEQLP